MRICFIIGSLKFSGAEKVLGMIAKELIKKGNSVSAVLLEQEVGIIGNEEGIVTYGAKCNGKGINRFFKRWYNIRKNVSIEKPDVVISFGSVCNVNMLAALFFKKVPKIICERNDPRYDPRSKKDRFIRWSLYRYASGYVFQTETIKNYFSKKIQLKSIIIPNPIIGSDKKWNINNCGKSIVTVARLDNYQKDHITMFKAFSKFLKTYPEYTLDVFGDGPDKEKYTEYILKNGLKSKVILHGKSANPTNEILKSEVFLLTSKYEGMPNALMEALSVGMPCISTDCGGGGAKFLFDMTNSGILVPVGDVDGIADNLKRVVSDERLKENMSENAYGINRILNIERICETWELYMKKYM